MQKAIAAERKIDNLSRQLGLTEQGKNWFDVALDPFKDVPTQPSGFPDTNMADSVVQVIKQSVDIATVSGGSNWDCNIFFDGIINDYAVRSTTKIANTNCFQRTGQGATPYSTGGLIIRQAAAGVPLYQPTTTNRLVLPTNYYTNSNTRVIAQAFEVVNTTAELNKQGSVSTWRAPGQDTPDDPNSCIPITDTATACISAVMPLYELPRIPETLAEATQLPGTEAWAAKEGAYVVSVLGSNENEPDALSYKGAHRLSNAVDYFPQLFTQGVANIVYTNSNAHVSPYVPGGAYFTGLSPTTTLKLNLIQVIERFVTTDNQDLTVLSYPSPPYDPAALELYTKLARTLPTGVPQRENGLGDWISSIAQGISSVASRVFPILNPILGAATTIANISKSDTDQRLQRERSMLYPERGVESGNMQLINRSLGSQQNLGRVSTAPIINNREIQLEQQIQRLTSQIRTLQTQNQQLKPLPMIPRQQQIIKQPGQPKKKKINNNSAIRELEQFKRFMNSR